MRRVLLLIIVAVFVISCSKSKENYPAYQNLQRGFKIVNSINNLKNDDQKKSAYSTLTNEERYLFWVSKLESLEQSSLFTQNQKAKIVELKSLITLGFFEGSKDKEIFLNYKFPDWYSSSLKLFDEKVLHQIAFSFSNEEAIAKSAVIMMSEPQLCHCAIGSSWTCYSGWGNFGVCYLTAPRCLEQSRGCGALLDDNCDGNACIYI